MKVLFISDEYPPTVGGAGIVAQQFVQDFMSSRPDDEIDIFCPPLRIGYKFIFKFFWPLMYLQIFIKYNVFSYDKLVVNDVRSAYFIGFILFLTRRKITSLIYVLHGTECEVVYNPSFKNRLILFPYFYSRFLLGTNYIVPVSKYTKDYFLKFCPKKISEQIMNKMIVQYAGVSLSEFKYDSVIQSRKMNESFGPFRLVSVSRIERRKGYFEMLDVFEDLLSVNDNVEWYIYGNGSCFDDLKKSIIEKDLQNKVFLMGGMDRRRIFNDEFKKFKFDLFWLLPNKPEAFGLVFIEAALVGTPTIGIDKYGVSESVVHFYTSTENLLKLIAEIKRDKISFIDEAHQFAIEFASVKFCNFISEL